MKLMSEFREGMWGVALRAVGLLDADALDPAEQLALAASATPPGRRSTAG